jgi:hypothetical protein
VGFPRHHLESLSELLVTFATSSSIDSEEDDGTWADADYSGLNDLGARRQFLDSGNYLLEGFDFDDESHDPSRECFMCDGGTTKEPPMRMRANAPRPMP